MGSAVSFGHRAVVNAEKNAIPVQPISEVSSAKNENLCDNPPLQEPLQIQIDAHRGRSCRDFHMSHGSPEGPFVIRSALSINSTLLTTPVRVSSSRSLGSASSRNHPSGPNSGDSRAFGARDAIDFLYRRSLISEPASPNDNASDNSGAADVFAQTAMSLGLDNDDLIFNMMYFDDGTVSNFGTMMNTMQQETLALHSENNTPYKLNPANEKAISHLIQEKYKRSDAESDNECAVCKDDIEDDADITRIPQCKHFFHSECLSRWIQLQSWCPVCRSSLDDEADSKSGVVHSLKFDSEEKDACGCSALDKLEDDSILFPLLRHNFAHDSAMKIINTSLGRVANREISCKE